MFIYLPDEGVLFVGDFIMPYPGALLWKKVISGDCSMQLTLSLKSIPSTPALTRAAHQEFRFILDAGATQDRPHPPHPASVGLAIWRM